VLRDGAEIEIATREVRVDDVMIGLRHFDERGRGYTRYAPNMRPEYPLSDLYIKMGQMVGLQMHK